jgi:DNA-binding NarL/FixJ family response regulator
LVCRASAPLCRSHSRTTASDALALQSCATFPLACARTNRNLSGLDSSRVLCILLIRTMPLRFLIIEDCKPLADALRRVLELEYAEAEVRKAANYSDGLKTAVSFRPDLIIADIPVGKPKSLNFAKKLRRHPRSRYSHLIAMTAAKRNSSAAVRLYERGFSAVFFKPFDIAKFVKKIGELANGRVNPDAALVYLGFEQQNHDYKEVVDLQTKDGRAELAKDVIAMANWGGGNIVIGVAEDPPGEFTPRGIAEELLNSLETSQVNRALRDFLDPPFAISVRRFRDQTGVFVILQVPPSSGTLILAKKQNDRAGLYLGRIYTRTSAAESAEVQNSWELRNLLNRLLEKNIEA